MSAYERIRNATLAEIKSGIRAAGFSFPGMCDAKRAAVEKYMNKNFSYNTHSLIAERIIRERREIANGGS